MKFTIEQDTLEKIATYLTAKPWNEVNGLINLISKAEPIKEDAVKVETSSAEN